MLQERVMGTSFSGVSVVVKENCAVVSRVSAGGWLAMRTTGASKSGARSRHWKGEKVW